MIRVKYPIALSHRPDRYLVYHPVHIRLVVQLISRIGPSVSRELHDSTWKNVGQSNRGQKENCEPKKVRFRGCENTAKGVEHRELHVSIKLTGFFF